MADKFRVTFAFSGKEHGWSETIIFDFGGGGPGALAAGMNNVAQKRAEMLGREFILTAFRVSKIRTAAGAAVKRNVFLSQVDFITSDQSTGNAADAPDAAILGNRFNLDGSRKAQFFVGAPPDKLINNGGDLNISINNWDAKFNAWTAALNAFTWGWLDNELTKTVGITNYVMAASGIVTFTSDAGTWGAGPYIPQYVRIHGLNSSHSTLNTSLKVLPLTDTTCKTVKARPCLPFVSDGFMNLYTQPFPFVAAVSQTAVKTANHKRGRPLFVSPGRRPAQVRV